MVGKIPVTSGVYIIQVRYDFITGKASFKNRSGMQSDPYELVSFKYFIVKIILMASVGCGVKRYEL